MSSEQTKKNQYVKKILNFLTKKSATSLTSLLSKINDSDDKNNASVLRSIKGLNENGLIQFHDSGQQQYVRLTSLGKKKLFSLNLASDTSLIDPRWDNKWRIIMLDLPEDRKSERESLRYLLKKAGFKFVKNSVWVSHFPFEYLFMNIKKDLGLTTEMMIFVSDKIDEETQYAFSKLVSEKQN